MYALIMLVWVGMNPAVLVVDGKRATRTLAVSVPRLNGMKRRNFLSAIGAAGAAIGLTSRVSAKEFEPDFVFDANHPLSRHVTVYLNGTKQRYSFEARVKWESFDRPVFGYLVVGSLRNGKIASAYVHAPTPDEFERDGCLCKIVNGEVHLMLDAAGREKLESFKQAYARYIK